MRYLSFLKVLSNPNFKPLVAVPSTYSGTTEDQLKKNGFSIVIYANQMQELLIQQ